jgi:hypothetical protein
MTDKEILDWIDANEATCEFYEDGRGWRGFEVESGKTFDLGYGETIRDAVEDCVANQAKGAE